MHFAFRLIESLPRLAWCAVLRRGDGVVQVFHGPWVETCNQFFLEGAWDGPFKEGLFDQSPVFMGSGARLYHDTIRFSTPCHSLEKLHFYKTGEYLYVSPSMVFLLKLAKRRLDLNYLGYEYDLHMHIQNLKEHLRDIPLDNKDSMLLCSYRNVEIDTDLNYHIQEKPGPPGYKHFAEYKGFLINGLSRLDENVRDPLRTVRYSPLATISSGYDSCACSALALEIGCAEAATILTARDQYHHAEDSGTVIGEKMGLCVREYEQDAYLTLPGFPEAEFVAMGGGGPDVVMAPMAELFCQRMVLTGIHGDQVWECGTTNNVSRDIIRPNLHGATFTEFRLRVGFIHVPVPFFGCLNITDLRAISQSEEMSSWTVGGKYDRPIARRLVEEHGIDRKAFGREKLATTIAVSGPTLQQMQEKMTPQSYDSLMEFYEEHKKKRKTLQQVWHTCLLLGYRLTRWGILKRFFPYLLRVRFEQEPFRLHWGISVLEKRYEIDGG